MSGDGFSPRRHGGTENDAPKELTTDEQTILDALILDRQVSERAHEKSAFLQALHDAMAAGHRNQIGDPDGSGEEVTWLSISGYMTLLDMIGRCFAPKNWTGEHDQKKSCFVKDALQRFNHWDLTPNDIEALHALRCSLAHDYSAARKDRNPKHAFMYRHDAPGEIVELPAKAWDGTLATARDHTTWVGVHQLVHYVHALFKKVVRMAGRGKLRCLLPDGAEELAVRYRVVTTKPLSVPPCLRGKKDR